MLSRESLTRLKRLFAVAGPAILLVAWTAQNSLFDRWNGKMSRLDSAEVSWDVYRSNHYVMNALRPEGAFADNQSRHDHILEWQQKNLRTAKERIRAAVDLVEFDAIEAATASSWKAVPRGSSEESDAAIAQQIAVFKRVFESERPKLQRKKDNAQYIFWVMYVIGSLVTIVAAAIKEQLEATAPK